MKIVALEIFDAGNQNNFTEEEIKDILKILNILKKNLRKSNKLKKKDLKWLRNKISCFRILPNKIKTNLINQD